MIWVWAEMTRNHINPSTKNNGVGRCRGGTLNVGLFILDYKSVIFSVRSESTGFLLYVFCKWTLAI